MKWNLFFCFFFVCVSSTLCTLPCESFCEKYVVGMFYVRGKNTAEVYKTVSGRNFLFAKLDFVQCNGNVVLYEQLQININGV